MRDMRRAMMRITHGFASINDSQALFEAAPKPKAFLELRGGHNDGFLVTGAAYASGIDLFLREKAGY